MFKESDRGFACQASTQACCTVPNLKRPQDFANRPRAYSSDLQIGLAHALDGRNQRSITQGMRAIRRGFRCPMPIDRPLCGWLFTRPFPSAPNGSKGSEHRPLCARKSKTLSRGGLLDHSTQGPTAKAHSCHDAPKPPASSGHKDRHPCVRGAPAGPAVKAIGRRDQSQWLGDDPSRT